MDQMKQNFDDLGAALKSGNLDDAKKAFAKLQKGASSQGSDTNNPMNADIESLKKALDSGDLKSAQDTYAKIQEKISQGPPAGGQPPSGPPPGEPKDTVELSSKSTASTTSSSDTKTYDKMDSNKDGTVTAQERLEYLMTQGTDITASSSTEDSASSSSKSSAKSSSTANKSYDKMDANKDGSVTAQEKSDYSMKHTSDTTSSSSISPYSGKLSIKTYA